MTIEFHFLEKVVLEKRNVLKVFLKGMAVEHGRSFISLKIIFCDAGYLLEINRTFLKHDFDTDIITFNLASPDDPIQGEIYICVSAVKQNAKIFKQSFANELHRVIFHGMLHLCGYGDKTKNEKVLMRTAEDKALKFYFHVPRETKG